MPPAGTPAEKKNQPDDASRVVEVLGGGRPADELFPVVYAELRRIAGAILSRRPGGQTLQPTALVHEAYARLVAEDGAKWGDPAYFFATAANAMRHVMAERARYKRRPKHGGDRVRLPLDCVDPAAAPPDEGWVELDELLTALAQEDARAAQVVELRVFAGLGVEKSALVLGVSEATIKRDWTFARAWLRDKLEAGASESST
jgi:RNA polymerase sigma factor (TIGR02999 family)